MKTRIENDSIGKRSIPKDAYYGIQTHRALENFPISGQKPGSAYIEATVQIKKAAALVNRTLGQLESRRSRAIVRACDEILRGRLHEWFLVDV